MRRLAFGARRRLLRRPLQTRRPPSRCSAACPLRCAGTSAHGGRQRCSPRFDRGRSTAGPREEQELPRAAEARLIAIASMAAIAKTPTVLQQEAVDALPSLGQPDTGATRVLDDILNRNVEPRYYGLQAHAARALLPHRRFDNNPTILRLAEELQAIEQRDHELALSLAQILYDGGEQKSQAGSHRHLRPPVCRRRSAKLGLFKLLLSNLNSHQILETRLTTMLGQRATSN